MQIIKYFMLFFVLLASSMIGKIFSKKYVMRVKELEEMDNCLNIFKTKINFTHEPIPEIFEEIAENTSQNVGQVFKMAKEKMKNKTANASWEEAIDEGKNYLIKEDRYVLKTLSKLLGQTDVEGQISQIDITKKFLETQIKEAKEQKTKNEKLYTKLGTTIGLAIIIILA